VAFAHPSIRERGAGRLYYELSDQRRGFVVCPHCGGEFWLSWEHVKAVPDVGMNRQQAERDPRLYRYFAPCCGTEISDAQRYAMARRVTQRTTLPAAEAARRSWIGVHFSQLYMPNKPLELLAKRWIDGAESEPIRRVFVNKCLGDVFDHSLRETSPDILRRLVVLSRGEDDPAYYGRGQVPKGVRFLTAGFDYRTTEFHFCVWGWGLVRDDTDYAALCGWLVDWGVYRRPYSATIDAAELRVFDGIYDQAYPGTAESARYFVEQGFHDAGWQPIPVYEYCRRRPFRAFPSKGSADGDVVPETTAAFLRWSGPPVWRIGEEEVRDERLRLCILNTFTLKEDWYGLAEKTFRVPAAGGSADIRTRFTLPRDVDDEWLAQSAAEHITTEKRKRVWKRRGPNHFGDCNIYAYAAARNLDPFQQGLPMDETKQETPRRRIDSPRVIRRAY
jgi:phage terminase large subunit GpA-like protein